MWRDTIRSEDVAGRKATQRLLLKNNLAQALSTARRIRHPWCRCQALAFVAEVLRSQNQALRILQESLKAAHDLSEPNRIVTVATWPIRHLVKLDPIAAAEEVRTLLSVADTEVHGLRRLHALDAVLRAVAEIPDLRAIVSERYLLTATVCAGWRAERTIAFMAEHMVAIDLALAKRMLAARKPNRFLNRAVDALRSHEQSNA